MANSWSEHTFTGGKLQRIVDLVASGTHELQVWGNRHDGWRVHLVSKEMPTVGIDVSPVFHVDFGDTRRALIETCERAYGVRPKVVR